MKRQTTNKSVNRSVRFGGVEIRTKKRTTTVAKPRTTAARKVNVKTAHRTNGMSSWSMSIYVYWFIILFFIAATFFILGRSQFTSTPRSGFKNGISEEVTPSSNHLYISLSASLALSSIFESRFWIRSRCISSSITHDSSDHRL